MSRDNQKIRKTIKKIGYAPFDGETGYKDIKWLTTDEEGGREYSAEPKGDSLKIYADGREVYNDPGNDGYEIKLILLAATDNVETAWFSCFKLTDEGVAEYSTDKENPHFALVIVEDTTDGKGMTTIFYDCCCSGRPSISGKTKEGSSWEAQFPEYTLSSVARESDGLTRYRMNKALSETTVKLPVPAESGSDPEPTE